ncbi:MAG: hypothetical protein K2X66_16870 [Cyanobacteria bacterium]|nr:hypothetical protein [Cyanobacteriota bacterium]
MRIIGVTALATTLTHPLLWFVLPDLLSGLDYTQYLVLGELGVILVEGVVLYKGLKGLSFPTALVISAVMNAGSYLIGGIVLYSDTIQ